MVQAASWQFANCSEGVGRAEFHAEGASADQRFLKETNWQSGDVAWQQRSKDSFKQAEVAWEMERTRMTEEHYKNLGAGML